MHTAAAIRTARTPAYYTCLPVTNRSNDYLSRNEDAIADATVLIDARASNRSDALYWRAWNHRRGRQLDTARADIEQARGYPALVTVFSSSGQPSSSALS